VYGGDKRCIQGFEENLKERDIGVDETRVLKWVLKELDYWRVAQDADM
jgi:hypothetical protein